MAFDKPGLEVELAADWAAASQARALVDRVGAGMPGDVGFRARLAASELVTNSVAYAARTPADRVKLTVVRFGTLIRVEVRDRGARFDSEPRSVSERATSGRGLRLVDALVDRWGTEHEDGNLVWFEIDEPSEDHGDPRSISGGAKGVPSGAAAGPPAGPHAAGASFRRPRDGAVEQRRLRRVR
jgi:anti-sigma regulatory factor (Ser/Thr protein kinase)